MKRIITYGAFSLMYYGHIILLKREKPLDDYLIVGQSTDEFNWNEKQKKCYFGMQEYGEIFSLLLSAWRRSRSVGGGA